MNACPALRPRWCPEHSPCRTRDCCLPAIGKKSRSLDSLTVQVHRPSQGLPPVVPMSALSSPIVRRVSRPLGAVLRLAPGRSGGAATRRWARGNSRWARDGRRRGRWGAPEGSAPRVVAQRTSKWHCIPRQFRYNKRSEFIAVVLGNDNVKHLGETAVYHGEAKCVCGTDD
jgi:hypothetical protein